jgi:hypothetical protein
MKRTALILTIAAAIASMVVAAQAAGGVVVTKVPAAFTLWNHPCTNEIVDFTGTSLIVGDTPHDGRGLELHSVDMALRGVGRTTGIRYVDTVAFHISEEGTPETLGDRALAYTAVFRSRIVAPGPGNDLVIAGISHLTINANNELAVTFERPTESICV